MRRSPAIVACAAVALVAVTACSPGDDDTASTGCATLIEAASRESEPADQVRRLDDALVACGSYDSFLTNLERFAGSIGYDPATYVERRCETVADDAVRDGATCAAVITPTTTVPPTTVVDVVFVGNTVDGRPIELRPSDGIEFAGDVPAVIQQTVDIALESECDGVIAQRDFWAGQIDETPQGDIASVYAQHAQNVADFIGCDASPLDG